MKYRSVFPRCVCSFERAASQPGHPGLSRDGGTVSPSTGGDATRAQRSGARPAGLEPATGGLETHCSIQLSYERV
jgi:hypothetical protein